MTPEETDSLIHSLITNTLDWQPLLNFDSKNSRKSLEKKEKHGSSGVYLVTLKEHLTSELIDANIGYIGKSKNIFRRVYDIRGGEHGVRKYLNMKSVNPETVYVKLLFTRENEENVLESRLHDEHLKRFGYKFSWKEASGGNDGVITRILSEIDKIESEDDLLRIVEYTEERAVSLYLENWRNK